jgi:hypothetical protein
MSAHFEAEKAPDEVLDFIIDWSVEMALSDPVDVVSSSDWSLGDANPDDLTLGAGSIVGTDSTVVRASAGGRFGVIHYLVNKVTTASGQIHQRTIDVKMVRR